MAPLCVQHCVHTYKPFLFMELLGVLFVFQQLVIYDFAVLYSNYIVVFY